MTRVVICGGPRTGKSTLADKMSASPLRSDDLITTHDWSSASQHIADTWLNQPGPWVIEGVAAVRALRKWRAAHPGGPPPVDRVIRLTQPHVQLSKGQASMCKAEDTVWKEIEPWIRGAVQVETI